MRFLARHRPSPALVVAMVALFVALSGLAVAGFKLPAKSVKAKNIAKGAVTGQKFALSTTVVLNFENVPVQQCAKLDALLPKVRPSDHIVLTPPDTTIPAVSYATAKQGAVTVTLCNLAAAPINPNPFPWSILVIRQ